MSMTSVIILGMHRSGTSCLAGSLEPFGLYLGPVNKAAPHNKRGNQEHSKVVDINNRVLQANGARWSSPPLNFPCHWPDSLRDERDRFLDNQSSQSIWGFKDPRTLLTLEGWLEGIPNAVLVGTFRNPISVAESLARRDGSSLQRGLGLWTLYNQRLTSFHRESPFPLISFDSSEPEYNKKIASIARSIGLHSEPIHAPFFETALRNEDMMNAAKIGTVVEYVKNFRRQPKVPLRTCRVFWKLRRLERAVF